MPDPLDKLFSSEAEYAVLGSVLLSKNANRVLDRIAPEDFFDARNQKLCAHMKAMRDEGELVDLVTFRNHLNDQGVLDSLGGFNHLVWLTNEVPATVAVFEYAAIVLKRSARRRLLHALKVAAENCHNADDITAIVMQVCESARDCLPETGSTVMACDVGLYMDAEEKAEFQPTFIPFIDDLNGGNGISKGEFTLIGGLTGAGKSLVLTQVATELAKQGQRTAFVSLEMSAQQLVRRMVRQLAGIRSKGEDPEAWGWACDQLFNARVELLDHSRERKQVTLDMALDWLQEQHERDPLTIGMIDYFGKLKFSGKGNQFEQMQLGAEKMRFFCKQTGITLLVATQINLENGAFSPRGGRPVEDDSAMFGSVIKGEQDGKEKFRWNVKKNRHGRTARCDLTLDGRYLRFSGDIRHAA